MKKIVIIGANDFQKPLILKAGQMGYETHVFAWREGATGAKDADYFYEISITEKEEILEKCREIKPDAVATIGSDLANVTVQYLSEKLGLPGNSRECMISSTNKLAMRKAFREAGIPVPFFAAVTEGEEIVSPSFPVIVKPTDRSGSRAITKVEKQEELPAAIKAAARESFEKKAIVEEYISGAEYSVETISFRGKHTCLAITKKFTTGEPHYIEVGHLQPAPLSVEMEEKVKKSVFQALDALKVENGAGHSELRIDRKGNIRIIEIGSRMGGDCIGSDLVPLSTGEDFVAMVVDTAAGKAPRFAKNPKQMISAIRFLMNEKDLRHLEYLQKTAPEKLKKVVLEGDVKQANIVDSGSRPGFYILQAETREEMTALLHEGPSENPVQLYSTPVQKLRFSEKRNRGMAAAEEIPSGKAWEAATQTYDGAIPVDGRNTFYMKRDDLLPFSFGGNKVRFAKKFVEDMQKKHCDSMIIYGNYHSNLCRILATLCKVLEMPCYMVHNTEDVKEDRETCNSRIIKKMGVHEISCGKQGIAEAVLQAMEELREKGYNPYYIYGNEKGEGNESVPMSAYVEAYEEICAWEEREQTYFDYIFLASSTNATQSGLLMGSLLHEGTRIRESDQVRDNIQLREAALQEPHRPAIVGISVSRNAARGKEVIHHNLQEYVEKLCPEKAALVENSAEQIHFTDAYMEGGYGAYSEHVAKLIRELYEEDGVYLDMTYTGKGFYGMMKYLEEQQIYGKNILFLHTGGAPLFFDFLKDEDGL